MRGTISSEKAFDFFQTHYAKPDRYLDQVQVASILDLSGFFQLVSKLTSRRLVCHSKIEKAAPLTAIG